MPAVQLVAGVLMGYNSWQLLGRHRRGSILLAAVLFAGCGTAPVGTEPPNSFEVQGARPTVFYVSRSDVLTVSGDSGGSIPGRFGGRYGTGFGPIATRGRAGLMYLAIHDPGDSATTSDLRLASDAGDSLLVEGCDTFALRADDTIACSRPDKDGTQVVVRTSDGAVAFWTASAADLVVLGWAGSELIVEELHGEAGTLPIIEKLSGPGTPVVLRKDAGVTAISPDGSRLLVDAMVDSTNSAMVIDVASGQQTGRVRLADDASILGSASWTDEGVAAAGFGKDATTQFAVVLHEDGDDLVEAGRVALPAGTLNGLAEPYLSGDGAIEGWTVDGSVRVDETGRMHETPYRLVSCSLQAGWCELTPFGASNDQLGRVRTPSRPTSPNASEGEQ